MNTPMTYGNSGLPVEARLERLEQNLRRLRRDLETAETVLGERGCLAELLRGSSPLLPSSAWPNREEQLTRLFD